MVSCDTSNNASCDCEQMEAESLEKCSNGPKSEWKHGCVFQVGSGGKQKLFRVAVDGLWEQIVQ